MSRMKIVLKQPVPKLGDPGDQVMVAGGYARNYLIPRGLAVPATKGNLKQAVDWQKSRSAQQARERTGAEQQKAKLEARPVAVTVQTGPDGRLFGSVTASDIASAIAAQMGTEVDRHVIDLDEPIKHVGVHDVKIKLHAEVAATVRVEVTSAA